MPDFHFPSNSFSRVCRSTMSNQQTFDFLDGYCSQSCATTGRVGSKESNRQQEDDGSPSVPEAVQEFRSRTDWQDSGVESVVLDPLPASIGDCSGSDSEVEGDGTQEQHRETVLRKLRVDLGCVLSEAEEGSQAVYSTGSDSLDGLLPRRGLRQDAITEWVGETESSGAAALSLIAAANLMNVSAKSGPLVVVCGESVFYPPAVVALGISVDRIIWVRPKRHADLVWSIDQALRCESVAAVWAHAGAHLDDRDARRFQLAAEAGQTAGLLVRPQASRGRPSFAEVRFHVRHLADSCERDGDGEMRDAHDGGLPGLAVPSHRKLQVTVDRCRGGVSGQQTALQIDDQGRLHTVPAGQVSSGSTGCYKDNRHETAAMHLASELAHPKTAKRFAASRRA